MNKHRLPHQINVLLFLITLYLNLMVQWDPKIWQYFPDTNDYLRQSNISFFSKDFFFTKPTPGFYPRPFTIPLCYKLAGSKGETIVQMQKFMHSLSVFVLVFALLLLLKTGISRYILMFFIYFLMSWWNILGWTTQLLSESLSMSFLFLWIATFMLYYVRRKPGYLVIHALVTILFSFTRDSWPYILVMFYLLLILVAWLWERPVLKGFGIMLLVSLAIFVVQERSSAIGERTKLPVMNNILMRVAAEPANYDWFVIKGMPMGGVLRQQYPGLNISDDSYRIKVYDTYLHPEYKPFRDWAAEKGKGLYTRFLITHPSYFFLLKEPACNLKRILAVNLHYTMVMNGYSKYAETFFPIFSPLSFLVLALLLLWAYGRTRKPVLLLPLVFCVIFLLNVFLIYNADSLEVERHLFITMIMVQLLSIWCVGLLLDSVFGNTGTTQK
jgi:hypothetical protein